LQAGHSATMIACSKGHVAILKQLLKQDKISPNEQDSAGNALLHYASSSEVIKLLVKHGATIDIINEVALKCFFSSWCAR
jgi:ankyrin repeat protein